MSDAAAVLRLSGQGGRRRAGGPGGARARSTRWWASGDHALVVEEIGGGAGDELNVGAVVDACLTPPFLVDRRVVVVREAGRLLTADVPRLVEVVEDPLPTTVLVLVGGGGTVPAPSGQGGRRRGPGRRRHDGQGGGPQGLVARAISAAAPVKLEPRCGRPAGGSRRRGSRPCRGPARRAERRLRRRGAASRPTIWRPISARRATSPVTS